MSESEWREVQVTFKGDWAEFRIFIILGKKHGKYALVNGWEAIAEKIGSKLLPVVILFITEI